MKNRHFKKFISCFLFERIEEVAEKYYSYLQEYKMCRTIANEHELEKVLLILEDHILAYFNSVLQDHPMESIQQFMEEKDKLHFLTRCQPNGNSPEDLIAEYMVLKEAVICFLPEYTAELAKKNAIVDELEALDMEVQNYIIENTGYEKES